MRKGAGAISDFNHLDSATNPCGFSSFPTVSTRQATSFRRWAFCPLSCQTISLAAVAVLYMALCAKHQQRDKKSLLVPLSQPRPVHLHLHLHLHRIARKMNEPTRRSFRRRP